MIRLPAQPLNDESETVREHMATAVLRFDPKRLQNDVFTGACEKDAPILTVAAKVLKI